MKALQKHRIPLNAQYPQVKEDLTAGEPVTREDLANAEARKLIKIGDGKLMETKFLTPRDFQILERLKQEQGSNGAYGHNQHPYSLFYHNTHLRNLVVDFLGCEHASPWRGLSTLWRRLSFVENGTKLRECSALAGKSSFPLGSR